MQTRVSSVAASLQATPPAGGTHQAAAQVVRVVELQLVLPSCHVGGIPQVLGLKAQADVAAQASDDLQAAQVALSSTGVVLLGDNTSLDKGLVDRTGHVGGWWSNCGVQMAVRMSWQELAVRMSPSTQQVSKHTSIFANCDRQTFARRHAKASFDSWCLSCKCMGWEGIIVSSYFADIDTAW